MSTTKSKEGKQRTPAVKVPRTRRVGDLAALRRGHWRAFQTACRALAAPGISFEQQMSAGHLVNQLSGSYAKIVEASDLQKQVDELRAELAELKGSANLRKVV